MRKGKKCGELRAFRVEHEGQVVSDEVRKVA